MGRMGQRQGSGSGNGVRGGFPKEGMAEGPAKERKNFSEDEIAYMKRRRAELILKGKRDNAIARVLAGEMKRPVGSIREKIRELVESGELEENPGKKELQHFSKEDVAYMKGKRAGLILEGKRDYTIARVLAGEMKWSAKSIEQKIYDLVESGELEENPNKQYGFSEKEAARIKKRRAELILEGKTDRQICRVLAGEMNRTAGSIEQKIRRLVESCELEENPNKINEFSEEEVARIKKRRAELILEGKGDLQISRVLATEMNRDPVSIINKIHNLARNGELGGNPNKKGRRLSEDELATELSAAVDLYLGDSP